LGTEFEAHNHDFYVLLTTVDNNYKSGNKLPRFVLERNIDAIIIAGKVPQDLIDNLNTYSVPLIFVDYYPSKGDYPTVLIDNIKGGMLATEHLIKNGHRNIGFIGGDIKHPSINDRFQGYKSALENTDINFNKNAVSTSWKEPNRSGGYQAAKSISKKVKNLSAIFACNDAMAIGAIQFFKDKGLNIPDDISIVGFDDVEADLLIDPPLTTVRVPKIEMGLEAMRLTVNAIKEGKKSIKKILIPVQLIERSSVKKIA
jgi:DNA-binding LacI/PurR family transcriptional regulator